MLAIYIGLPMTLYFSCLVIMESEIPAQYSKSTFNMLLKKSLLCATIFIIQITVICQGKGLFKQNRGGQNILKFSLDYSQLPNKCGPQINV